MRCLRRSLSDENFLGIYGNAALLPAQIGFSGSHSRIGGDSGFLHAVEHQCGLKCRCLVICTKNPQPHAANGIALARTWRRRRRSPLRPTRARCGRWSANRRGQNLTSQPVAERMDARRGAQPMALPLARVATPQTPSRCANAATHPVSRINHLRM